MKSGERKIFVLDTNLLLHDPLAFRNFGDNDVYIPLCVIQELDRKKKVEGVLGANSRSVATALDKLCNTTQMCIGEGIPCNEEGGRLFIFSENYHDDIAAENIDHVVIDCCVSLSLKFAHNHRVILVTKDKYLRVIANYRGIVAEDYRNDKVNVDGYSGQREVLVPKDVIEELYSYSYVPTAALGVKEELYANECVTLIDMYNPKHSALGIVLDDNRVELIPASYSKVLNLKALSAEQRFAIRILTDPSILLVTISGATGSGKTILAVAAALQQVERKLYKQIVVTRTEVPVGKGQGFLPGNIKEKTDPWLASIYGCLDQLVGCKDTGGKDDGGFKAVDFYLQQNMLRCEALSYIRGVTWMNSIIVCDEAQNAYLHELKAIITRAGEDREGALPSKVILLGDNDQIDNEFLDRQSNGLSKVIDRFKGWKEYAHLTLEKNVRGALSREAGRRL